MTPSTQKPAGPRPVTPGGTPPEGAAEASNLLAELRGGAGAEGAEAVPFTTPRFRRPKTADIVIGVVIAASIGVIYAMRLHGMGLGMSLALDKIPVIDYDLERRPVNDKDQARILKQLKTFEPFQNAHGSLDKNPFRLAESGPADMRPVRDPNQDPEFIAKVRDAEIKSAYATLELQAVMNGRIPIAKINNKIVKVGDRVKSGDIEFTVTAIHDRTVELELDGKVYALSMHDPAVQTSP